MTKQRELIYLIIQNSCDHMTANEIFLKAKEQMPAKIPLSLETSV